MPNWCDNMLRITGPNEDVAQFKQKGVGSSPWNKPLEIEKLNVLNFHSLVPVPDDVLKAGYRELGYNWELANWDCKWGARHAELLEDDEGCLLYSFDTAWSPPIAFLEAVASLWPTLTFVLEYEEGGMGFKGLARAQAESIEDHCIDL